MSYFYVYRNIILGLCLLLTIPVLGLTAHWTQGSGLNHTVLSFEGMGLFISIFSFIVMPVMLILPEFRKNAFFLYIVSEMVIVLLLWVLWMTAAILVIEQRQDFYPLDNCQFLAPNQVHWCNELFAIQGLTITIFVLLIKYLLILLIFSFVNHSRGVYVWTSSVKDLQLTLPKIQMTHTSDVDATGNPIKKEASLFGAPATYPPASQNSYPPPSTTAAYNQPQYSGSSAQLTPQRTGEPIQLNQSVTYSRPQPTTGNASQRSVVAPAQQSMYAHYNPPSANMVPSAPQV